MKPKTKPRTTARTIAHLRKFSDVGVDQVTFIQQAGMNQHAHICESLELFAEKVMPEFKAREAEREAEKMRSLAPYLEAAMARKIKMPELDDADIPVYPALGRRITEEAKEAPSIYSSPEEASEAEEATEAAAERRPAAR